MKSIRSVTVGGVSLVCALCARTVFASPAWTNVAGNVIVGDVTASDATSVTLVSGAVTQRVARTVFPKSELARMGAVADATACVPSAIAPVWREFMAKCEAKTVTRSDLIVFKRFVSASALTEDEKKSWTQKARKRYQEAKKSNGKKGLE